MATKQMRIAAELGVSQATVSRALRGDPSVKEETRRKIVDAAQRHGYAIPSVRPAVDARSGDPLAIAVIYDVAEQCSAMGQGSVAMRLLSGMSLEAGNHGLTIHPMFLPNEQISRFFDPSARKSVLMGRRFAGYIFFGKRVDATDVERIDIPAVSIIHRPVDRVDCVDHDDAEAARRLVDYLYSIGHERIGYIWSGDTTQTPSRRLSGHIASSVDHGHAYDPETVIPFRPAPDAVCGRVAELTRNGVTAWWCINDDIGYRVIHHLRGEGLRVPEDVSICGFDNLPAPVGFPKLTTMNPPFELIGRGAVQRLCYRRLHMDEAPVRLTYDCELVVGESTVAR